MVGDHMGILGAVVLFTFYLFFLPSHTLLPLPFFSYLYIFFLPSHTLFLFLPEPTDLFGRRSFGDPNSDRAPLDCCCVGGPPKVCKVTLKRVWRCELVESRVIPPGPFGPSAGKSGPFLLHGG
jgi:hypothetical protein